ncbi:MAG TPA: adenylate/guanylate cyclase domain-containing protein [Anaerolineales bacterium]|nr:adenylate/guanylate cyclase domain-containing protein [Anaerolineales bacterium]HMV96806.1 adenylate/guanylate cyclase domain-containing protein [Anaerolineales bacterium]HMX20892.1 adenylate/guanylate cyclase domain-containing protein [Anaerolineales bacterium]HMX72808.1 adenylate/guanylate cyclase domain-containing protein [Anaerolineales bacterium]HMZ41827.1 adenylate/guanylate cyclase domain-containing protein [Anaerolineales bacterium]
MNEQTRPTTVPDQLQTLSLQVGKIRIDLEESRLKLPKNTGEDLRHIETSLMLISEKIDAFQREHNNMLALANIGQVVNSSLELDEVLRIVMDNIVRLTKAERGFLMLRDDKGEMVTRMARNWEMESIHSSELTVSRSVVGRVIETGEPIITTNAQEDQRFVGQESIVAFNLRSILCVPLKVKNDLIGVIYADNRIRAGIFADSERNLLVAFANQAAVAIENARLFSSLKNTLEEVTGLKNLMDNIFASIASGVITADIQNQITLTNRAAERILGSSSSDIIGHHLNETLASVSSELEPHLTEVRQTDKPIVDLEISHHLPNHGNVDWRFNLSPLKDAGQKTQGIAIVLDDLTERKKLEAQRRLFERMVSPAVIEQLDPNSLQLGGKRTNITTLFADIRGFTSFSENQEPEKLVQILNRYLAAMAEAVLVQAGTIDKFMGDAIMAWFNAPIPQPDHTLRAVKTALIIRESVENLYKELPPEFHLGFGAGIHCGDAVLGLIGTEKRLEYTAISDAVNTAKRIQENSARNQILISASAYERVSKEINARPHADMSVKGKTQPLGVFEVLGLK